ncbi:gliding motility lipoprotein GldH [Chryseobacterium sp. SC28]|uniref:gliding motility lipoprotein GldH n=1 Tax=Chryseobacterium sp. SC28 TaxID=2268028 RepID=UPI000F64E7C5|nr:gliding motility lipoprotein GldH [Chryseobacterium sp. SC28]RRQ45648.1 gliding motility lipoprotein GldH [Chryseobacterium sp. SC28]
MKVILKSIIFASVFLSLMSCQDPNEQVLMNDVDDDWRKNDIQRFDFEVKDAPNLKNLMIVVRNNNDYPYSNLRLIANIEHDKKTIATDTLNYILAKPNGEWIGSGFGETKEIIFQYKLNYKFPQNGNYSIKLVQAMRRDTLPGIEDIGIKIQNLKPSFINGK